MRRVKITRRAAKICDYTLWTIAMVLAFWADWRAGVALMAFDAMRAFEDIASSLELRERVSKLMKEDKEAAK